MDIPDRKARIAVLRRRGMSIREIADATGIPRSTVGRLVQEVEGTGPGCLGASGTNGTVGTAGTRGRGSGTPGAAPGAVVVEAQALAGAEPEAVPLDGPTPSYAELSDKARRVLGAALDRLLVTFPNVRPRDLNRTVEVTAKVAAMFRERPAADARRGVSEDFDRESAIEEILQHAEAVAEAAGMALVPVERLEGGGRP